METWKVMAWAAGIIAVFGIVVSTAGVPVSGPTAVVALVIVSIASVVFYAISRRGYQFGHQIGEQMTDDE